jgi:hypothetical protein
MTPIRGPVDSPATLREVWQLSGKGPIRPVPEPVMRQPFCLLVTGSQTWGDTAVIEHAPAAILAHGILGTALCFRP